MNRRPGTPSPLLRQGPCNWLFILLFIMFPLLFPSCRPTNNWVAGMTGDLPTPCRPVHHLVRSQSSTFPSLVGLYLSILFSVVLSSCSLVYKIDKITFISNTTYMSAVNTFLSTCSSSLLTTCPCQFNIRSVIFLEACTALVVPRICLCVSLRISTLAFSYRLR